MFSMLNTVCVLKKILFALLPCNRHIWCETYKAFHYQKQTFQCLCITQPIWKKMEFNLTLVFLYDVVPKFYSWN